MIRQCLLKGLGRLSRPGYCGSYYNRIATDRVPMVLCETPWDMDSSMTWANINHMGPYATSREPKHLDVSSTALTGSY